MTALPALIIFAALAATAFALWSTLAVHGGQIGRALRMEPLPLRGADFRVRQQRQPVLAYPCRPAPDRAAIRHAAA